MLFFEKVFYYTIQFIITEFLINFLNTVNNFIYNTLSPCCDVTISEFDSQ